METRLYKQRSVDVLVNNLNAGASVQFPEQMDLQNAYIVAMEIFTVNDISISPQTYSTVMSLADMKNCFVNLYRGDTQVGYRIPILNFHRMYNASTDPHTNDQFLLDNVMISWTKCTIEVGATLSSNTSVIPFSVYYMKYDDIVDVMKTDVLFEKVRNEQALLARG